MSKSDTLYPQDCLVPLVEYDEFSYEYCGPLEKTAIAIAHNQ